jgi:glycosyltransferase involved in cell wall biosynthesis
MTEKQTRICYLANAMSVHSLRWVNYFAEHGYHVDMITWHALGKNAVISPRVVLHRLFISPHYPATYASLLEVAPLILRIKPDLIHAHYLSHFGLLGSFYSKLFNFKPFVLTVWGSDILREINWFNHSMKKQALSRADVITCDADHMVKVLTNLGAVEGKVKLIYFGTDTQKFKPMPRDMTLETNLNLNGAPTIISLRNFRTIYNIDTLIKSIPLVLEKVPQATFIIAGDGPERKNLYSLARELGVLNSIRFTGFLTNEDLPRYINLADVYVSTSLSDAGLSASTAEAMACGLPVVITEFGDNGLWIINGINGYLVPSSNPAALADKITNLLQNDEKRHQFGKANRMVIDERNNCHKEMAKMDNIYKDLIVRYKK